MKKFLKWSGIVLVSLAILLFAGFQVMKYQTKKASPEIEAQYKSNGKDIEVEYSSPSKRNREIFGALVPYGEVWRTGANEATTFETKTDLTISGRKLPAGKYTLWTIPNQTEWTIIFNSKQYGWGMGWDGKIPREPEADALQLTVPVQNTETVIEQFTINFAESPGVTMNLMWDNVKVSVPIE